MAPLYIRHLSIVHFGIRGGPGIDPPWTRGVTVVVTARLGVPKPTGNLRNARHSSELPRYACPTGTLRTLGHACVGEDGVRQGPGRQAHSGRASGSTESPEADTHAMAPLLRM